MQVHVLMAVPVIGVDAELLQPVGLGGAPSAVTSLQSISP
jgi:hypothetical protein